MERDLHRITTFCAEEVVDVGSSVVTVSISVVGFAVSTPGFWGKDGMEELLLLDPIVGVGGGGVAFRVGAVVVGSWFCSCRYLTASRAAICRASFLEV